MLEALKKILILAQVILVLALPFFIRITPERERPALYLTPYAINRIQAQLRQPSEESGPWINRTLMLREFRLYCTDHHLPIDLSDLNS